MLLRLYERSLISIYAAAASAAMNAIITINSIKNEKKHSSYVFSLQYALCNILTSYILLFYCLVKEFVYVLYYGSINAGAAAAGDHDGGSVGVDGVGGVVNSARK